MKHENWFRSGWIWFAGSMCFWGNVSAKFKGWQWTVTHPGSPHTQICVCVLTPPSVALPDSPTRLSVALHSNTERAITHTYSVHSRETEVNSLMPPCCQRAGFILYLSPFITWLMIPGYRYLQSVSLCILETVFPVRPVVSETTFTLTSC